MNAELPYYDGDLHYCGGDLDTQTAIVRTLDRLPTDVGKLARSMCLFLSTGDGIKGSMFALHAYEFVPAYIITLDREAMRGERAQDIVAHEIAHAWLDHSFEGDSGNWEAEADQQAVEWGFRHKE